VLPTWTPSLLAPAGTAAGPDPALAGGETTETDMPAAPTQTPVPPSSTEVTASPGPATGETGSGGTVPVTEPTQVATPDGAGAEGMIALAVADLATQLGVDEKGILVRSVEEVKWADASLGCPQPGMVYAQVITPGYRVLLESGAGTYEYHTDQDLVVVLCTEVAALPDAPAASGLPIFLEMVQAPLSPEPVSRMPPADGTPTGAFAFDLVDRSLLLPPSVQILPATEVVVGVLSSSTPDRPYIASELFQLPSSQAAPVTLLTVDAESGTLTLAYAGQTFELGPGESRSFKDQGDGEPSLVKMTTFTNHGRIEAVGLLPAPVGP
jgi:hypothetical protein